MLFCDTSTLAKFYVPEPESGAVRARLDAEDRVIASELARAELMGVFHRRLREHKWKRADFLAVVRQFEKDHISGYWSWAPLDGKIVDEAARTYATLSEAVFLRTADILHLITALRHGFAEIHTHDLRQIEAAPALGLAAINLS